MNSSWFRIYTWTIEHVPLRSQYDARLAPIISSSKPGCYLASVWSTRLLTGRSHCRSVDKARNHWKSSWYTYICMHTTYTPVHIPYNIYIYSYRSRWGTKRRTKLKMLTKQSDSSRFCSTATAIHMESAGFCVANNLLFWGTCAVLPRSSLARDASETCSASLQPPSCSLETATASDPNRGCFSLQQTDAGSGCFQRIARATTSLPLVPSPSGAKLANADHSGTTLATSPWAQHHSKWSLSCSWVRQRQGMINLVGGSCGTQWLASDSMNLHFHVMVNEVIGGDRND